MTLRVAPIIHTRTFSCDFNTEFLVRPDRFMDSDIKWARKNVLGATGEIDGLQGVRWLIADNEKYRLAGVVGFLKSICSKCQLSMEDKQRSEELFCDNKGRLVYAFIGVVIDKINNIDYGKLTYEYLWNMYLSKMYPIWKRTYQEVSLEPFTDIKVEIASKFEPRESVFVGSKELLESNQALDYDLFIDYLCNNNKSYFSFCSNIMDFNMVKQSDFSIVTTSQNIITRMKRDNTITPSSESEEQQVKESLSIEEKEPIQATESKKKSFVTLMICLLILLAITLMLLLTKKTDSDQNNGQLTLNVSNEMNIQNRSEELVENTDSF